MELKREKIEKILREYCGIASFERGLEYFRKKRVIAVSGRSEGDKIVIESKVKGNYRSSYAQKIYIDNNTVSGDCTCPVGYNCKHVVAAVLEFINRNSEKKNTSWLKRLRLSLQAAKKERKTSCNYVVTYRIYPEAGFTTLSVYKSRVLKDGTLTKGQKLSLKSLISDPFRDYVTPEDVVIFHLMEGLRYNYYSRYSYILGGKTGFAVLEAALRTGRIFWSDSFSPILPQMGSLSISCRWKYTENGFLKPVVEPDLKKFSIVPVVPLLVYDHSKRRFLKIEDSINYDSLNLLLSAPHLAPEEASLTCLILRDTGINVEPVKEIEVVEITDPPTPVMYLRKERDRYIAEVKFRYGERILSFNPDEETIYFLEGGKNYVIKRDIDREKKFIDRLKTTYFKNIFLWGTVRNRVEVSPAIRRDFYYLKMFFFHDVPELEKEGWEIVVEDGFLNVEEGKVSHSFQEEEDGWFSLSFKVKIGDKELFLLPIVREIFLKYDVSNLPEKVYIEYEKDCFVTLKKKDVEPIINTISQLLDRAEKEHLKITRYDLHLLDVEVPENLKEIKERLKNFKRIEKVSPPAGLNAKLRNYQIEGLSWLNFIHTYGAGGILADDMGLGKTIQTIAHLLRLKEKGELNKPALIIVPTSLIANWEREISRFAPSLGFETIYGEERKEKIERAFEEKKDILLTTYNLILKDKELYSGKEFSYIILDEAQKIKNHRTKTYKSVISLKGAHRLALSGTPIENHLGELWAIFNFIMPGFLGIEKEFRRQFKKPIEEGDEKTKAVLGKKIRPFILRRTKEEVLKELPPKTEIVKFVKFGKKEAELYESVRILMEKKVREAIERQGFERSHIFILDALLKLRQICCHPSLLKIKEARKVKESAKLELLKELLEELKSEGRKVIIFSQFVSMLEIIEKEVLVKGGYSYEMLTGSTRNRKKVIESFKKGKDVFLISLKAGGLGLNLTEADTVILYEPWWNPAVENQATDRVHRIGQEKKVFVYKFIVENSVEEKILELQKKKKDLQALYEESVNIHKLSREEILSLFES